MVAAPERISIPLKVGVPILDIFMFPIELCETVVLPELTEIPLKKPDPVLTKFEPKI